VLFRSDVIEAVLIEADAWRACEVSELPEATGPVVWGIDLGATAAMSALACYWPATGRLECFAAFPSVPDLEARGRRDAVGSLYREMAGRGAYLCARPECWREALSQRNQGRLSRLNWRALPRDPVFWALMVAAVMTMGPVRSLTVHQIAYMESAGVARAAAANVVGLAGLLTSGFFIGLGWVSDRFGRASAYTIGAAGLLGAVGMLVVMRAVDTPVALVLYALCFAMGEGARSSQTTALASDVFQRQGLGLINGLVGGLGGLGAALGPWLVGRLRDESGRYDGGLLVIVVMVLLSLAAFWAVARRR